MHLFLHTHNNSPTPDSINPIFVPVADNTQSQDPDTTVALETKSFFTEHELPASNYAPEPIARPDNGWILPVLMFCFALFAAIQVFYRKRFIQIIRASYSNQQLNLLIREGTPSGEWITRGLGFITLITTSLFLYQINDQILHLEPPANATNIQFYLIILAIYSIFLIFKFLLIQISSIIFLTRQVTIKYFLNSLIFNIIIGILLLPILLLTTYSGSPILIKMAIGLVGSILIYKLFKSIIVGLSNTKFSIVYLFLYLCTVEILPVLLLIKFVMNYYHIS